MTPRPKEGGDVPTLPGRDLSNMERNKELERPVWSSQGTLLRKPPMRHYIPRHPFYYTTQELFESTTKTRQDLEADTRRFVAQSRAATGGGDARRAFSAPGGTRKLSASSSSKLPPLLSQGKVSSRHSRQAGRYRTEQALSQPECVPWVSTPVPGMRTIPEYDLYRKDAIEEKNPCYLIDSGLLPKYMGYVPGLKFRYGSTFGRLTHNAKEIGVEQSATWGGAVSLV